MDKSFGVLGGYQQYVLQVSCLKLHFSLIKVVISVCFLPSQKDVFRNLSQITALDHIRVTNSKISVFNSVKNVQSFFFVLNSVLAMKSKVFYSFSIFNKIENCP